ncbi:hypothetical protein ABW19_dt0203219 [Dactylella cylindrospora]|nr:hypothetical protein ABW19_dt0203219 [Dactylella cylindrospora]
MRLRTSSLKTSLARYVRVPAALPSSDMSTCNSCKLSFLQFRPLPVTIFTVVIYLSLFIPLLIIHYVPPSPPPIAALKEKIGVDLEETWHSLANITRKYHPYNSHANDDVRTFLVDRINTIIERNGNNRTEVVEDTEVNVLYAGSQVITVYFESLNIIVKVQGSGKFEGEVGDVLVNAHYDSVSTAPGATDDGVAVVTVLGLIDYFTQPNHTPLRSVFFLLNNGEEDYLNGAMAFTEHPLAKTCRIFLNLEGAGAGGRATLFRSTDAEVTQFYKRAKYPFGSSLSGDAFKRGVIRSQTDYIIFDGELGMRGLDVAFWQPRARYHTQYDSMAFTSINSLWHMFETALSSTTGMAGDGGYTFIQGSGRKHTGVWFDMFGRGFAILQIGTAFITSMCLLTITPFFFFLIIYFLAKSEKLYLFASSPKSNGPLPPKLELAGYKGFWRPLVAIAVSSGGVFGAAMLINKVNPMILYSSQEAVWVCLISLWIVLAWVVLRGFSFVKPSATARTWALAWLSLIIWLFLIVNALAEDRLDVGGLYFFIPYYAATALALVLGLLEMFLLPPTSHIYESIPHASLDPDDDDRHSLIAPSVDGDRHLTPADDEEDEAPNETTSLLRDPSNLGRGRHIGRRPNSHGSLSIGGASTLPTIEANEEDEPECSSAANCSQRQYPGEQYWSRGLPKYTWILQALVLIPIPVILTAQLALIVGTSVAQTGADGNPQQLNYTLYSFFTILILLPLLPFIHRWTRHFPAFLFLVFVATLLYLLLAFPFSLNSPLKLYFSQKVFLAGDKTLGQVNLVGAPAFVKPIIEKYIPDTFAPALGPVTCEGDGGRRGLMNCQYWAPLPDSVPGVEYKDWVTLNTTLLTEGGKGKPRLVSLSITAKNSRACRVHLNSKVDSVSVSNPTGKGVTTPHKNPIPEGGTDQIRLWSRDWGRGWEVEISGNATEGGEKISGTVKCLWSDANERGFIPALDELKRFLPNWAVVTKLEDGLVIGEIDFSV